MRNTYDPIKCSGVILRRYLRKLGLVLRLIRSQFLNSFSVEIRGPIRERGEDDPQGNDQRGRVHAPGPNVIKLFTSVIYAFL